MNLLWPNDWVFSDLNNITILSKLGITIFVYISCLSEHSFIEWNNYQYIRLICMLFFACHLCMHARISWNFANSCDKMFAKPPCQFFGKSDEKWKKKWFGLVGLVWLGFLFCLDCKAMAGELVCQMWIQLVEKWLRYYTKRSSLLSKNVLHMYIHTRGIFQIKNTPV